MKLCPNCSAKNENSAGFCKSCGSSLAEVSVKQEDFSSIAGNLFSKAKEAASAGAKKAQQAAAEGAARAMEHRQEVAAHKAEAAAMKKAEAFIDPTETVRATLGSNFAQNALTTGKVVQGSAVLTEKRLYYKGDLFSGTGKNLMSIKGEYIVPVGDISMTSFVHGENTGVMLVGIVIFLVGLPLLFLFPPAGIVVFLAGIVFFAKGLLGKTTVFEIPFPGGRFRFDVKWYPIANMREFQRQIHLTKDSLNA